MSFVLLHVYLSIFVCLVVIFTCFDVLIWLYCWNYWTLG